MLRVLLIGFGMGARIIHAPLIAACEGLELAGVVSSRTAEIAAAWPDAAIFPDLTTALAHGRFDLAVICTPNAVHAAQAHAALDAGLHLVVDKPFALDLAEARSIADHARQAGRLVAAFQNRRWDGHILTAKALLDAGVFGQVSDVRLGYDRLRLVNPARWGDQPGPGSGIRLNLGSHLVDQAVHLFGAPQTVMADIFTQRPDALIDDYVHIVLGYAGFRVVLHACMSSPAPGPVIAIQGTHAAFVKYGEDTQEAMLKLGRIPGDDGWGVDPVVATFTPAEGETILAANAMSCDPGNYPAFYAGIAAAIRDTAPSPVPIEETLLVTHILDLARQSAEEGRRLEVAWPA